MVDGRQHEFAVARQFGTAFARIGLCLGWSDEEFLFWDVRESRFDLVVELPDGLEVYLEWFEGLLMITLVAFLALVVVGPCRRLRRPRRSPPG